MLTGFQEFAATLAATSFWPLVAFTAFSVSVMIFSYFARSKTQIFKDVEYDNSTWRMFTFGQMTIAFWVIWFLVDAVPNPNYIYQTKVVEKIVNTNTATTYKEGVKACIDLYSEANLKVGPIRYKNCEVRGLVLARPDLKVIKIHTEPGDQVSEEPKGTPTTLNEKYDSLLTTCLDQKAKYIDVTAVEYKNCEAQARAVVRPDIKTIIRTVKVDGSSVYRNAWRECMNRNDSDQRGCLIYAKSAKIAAQGNIK